MHVNNMESLAILNGEGVYITAISGSDLRGFTHEKLSTLFLPVLDFLKLQGSKRHAGTCKSSNTIREVIALMLQDHVRYIWVVDDLEKPKGVITMADIASYFYANTLDVWYPSDGDT